MNADACPARRVLPDQAFSNQKRALSKCPFIHLTNKVPIKRNAKTKSETAAAIFFISGNKLLWLQVSLVMLGLSDYGRRFVRALGKRNAAEHTTWPAAL